MTVTTGNFRHPRCWASSRGGCDQKISLEHYVSETVLGVLGIEHLRSVAHTGGRADVSISRRKFGSNVLCRRHNSDLSHLDAHARLLFLTQRLLRAEINAVGFTPENEQIDISGDLLEKWLLKCLVAQSVAKVFTSRSEQLHPPDLAQVAALVFDETPWPHRWGLWMRHRPDIVLDLRREMAFQPIHMFGGDQLGGGSCSIGGLEFWISLFNPAAGDGGPFDGAVHRPSGIVYQFPGFTKVIGLHWSDGSQNSSIAYRVEVR
ncbi:hypothetical protein AB0J74_07635 [Asanoa sp. NPDC049573]|uniref:hypothetical protein n=1 Tax=Asanoa sp. NPDC049573 TaxID=3155396 RepID=UPI00343FDA7E